MQLRQFPNVTRAFNLSRAELDARILGPWTAGESVAWDDRKWSPDRAKLTIYEGPELRPEEMGIGRGWANVTRSCEDVTARLLSESAPRGRGRAGPDPREHALVELREQILARAGEGPLQVRGVVELATELCPEWRASDRLALAEQALWELLHLGSIRIVRAAAGSGGGGAVVVERERWQPLLFDWATWAGDEASRLIVEASE
jgi:hypothetical protein